MKTLITAIAFIFAQIISPNANAITMNHYASIEESVITMKVRGWCTSIHTLGYAYELYGNCFLKQGSTLKAIGFEDFEIDAGNSHIFWATTQVTLTCNCMWTTRNESRYLDADLREISGQHDGVTSEFIACGGSGGN